MIRLATSRLLLAVLSTAALAACSDAPVSRLTARAPSLQAGTQSETKHSAGRSAPLSAPITRSIDVNHKGGEIEIKELGFKLTIPKNAIRANQGTVHMTVTALPGDQIAYEFQPSGITFDRPLEFEQDVRSITKDGTVDPSMVPQVSYFKSTADLDPKSHKAQSYEDLPSSVDVSGQTLKTQIWHFSGYIVSWGFR